MPPFTWPTEPVSIIAAFEGRHAAPEAGALLMWAVSSVAALYYLADVDAFYDSSPAVAGWHSPDVIDVAHARWAAGTSITTLDLCVAALGRAICKHRGSKELDLGSFDVGRSTKRPSKQQQALRSKLPSAAVQWLDDVFADPKFTELKDARDALTHRRLPRHFSLSIGSSGPDERIKLQVGANRVKVADLVVEVRDLATTHVAALIQILPNL